MYLNSAEFKELKSITAYVCNITQEMAETSFQAFINKDVEKAQHEIVAIVREHDEEGVISIGGGEEEQFI